jgi:hypothetical protein
MIETTDCDRAIVGAASLDPRTYERHQFELQMAYNFWTGPSQPQDLTVVSRHSRKSFRQRSADCCRHSR